MAKVVDRGHCRFVRCLPFSVPANFSWFTTEVEVVDKDVEVIRPGTEYGPIEEELSPEEAEIVLRGGPSSPSSDDRTE